ncbi:hypothetical protein [Streptomyces sp. NPDC006477]|uniref:hypothetical protein n=1 Tax=Streptomyces sp. NPDC006477 TaxID=3364747 RepID=UPI0036AF6D27
MLTHEPHEPGEHHLSWEQGSRPVAEPKQPGWAEYEHDGTMRVQCCCGLDTGWTARDDAMDLYQDHLRR